MPRGKGMYLLQSSPYVPEFADVQKTVNLSWRERWLTPLRHPVTVPFEPWVQTKTETVRERTFYSMGSKIFAHPNNMDYARKHFDGGYFGSSS